MQFAGLAILTCLGAAPGQDVRIDGCEDPTCVVVTATVSKRIGVADGPVDGPVGEKLLRFCRVDAERGTEGEPIVGRYERRGRSLVFQPTHRLAAGQRYRATLVDEKGKRQTADYRVPPRRRAEPAEVVKVYPSNDIVPANLLKFYLYFSRPMRESREVFDHLELRKEDGDVVVDPWRRTELWSENATRLTLWIHPGRVKEGVNLREQLGPVLEPGKSYTLVVRSSLLDASGRPLRSDFTRLIRVGPPLRERVEVADWKIDAPSSGTREPATVSFPRPLDHALLSRFVNVVGPDGKRVAGQGTVAPGETRWLFQPAAPWLAADYTLEVNERLEDLAGNTPVRVFDLDLSIPKPAQPPVLDRRFRPGR